MLGDVKHFTYVIKNNEGSALSNCTRFLLNLTLFGLLITIAPVEIKLNVFHVIKLFR